ncbi:MAG: hypothetical protein K6B70_03685 [Clostridia bacterium]|nr:hypothetical protein [Clostridia bacterium]
MKNNKLIIYKESIFSKISYFFKKIFHISSKDENKTTFNNINYNLPKEEFINNIVVKENADEARLKELQLKYENGEIDGNDISDEDMDKLIEMYKNETEKLNLDTEKRKEHISKMLNELKGS